MTFLTDRQVAQNLVSQGVVTLRWYDPRWAGKIIRPIDVLNCALSPLGQIFGNNDEGLRVLGLTEAEAIERGLLGRPGSEAVHLNDLWNERIQGGGQEAK